MTAARVAPDLLVTLPSGTTVEIRGRVPPLPLAEFIVAAMAEPAAPEATQNVVPLRPRQNMASLRRRDSSP